MLTTVGPNKVITMLLFGTGNPIIKRQKVVAAQGLFEISSLQHAIKSDIAGVIPIDVSNPETIATNKDLTCPKFVLDTYSPKFNGELT